MLWAFLFSGKSLKIINSEYIYLKSIGSFLYRKTNTKGRKVDKPD